jgi:hypothetical protein
MDFGDTDRHFYRTINEDSSNLLAHYQNLHTELRRVPSLRCAKFWTSGTQIDFCVQQMLSQNLDASI